MRRVLLLPVLGLVVGIILAHRESGAASQGSASGSAVPSEERAILVASARCGSGEISLGNPTSVEISYVSGKFVVEHQYPRGWYAGADLGGFFAEMVPPHGWRTAKAYGAGNVWCDSKTRVRIVRIEHCVLGGRDFAAACAANMKPQPPESGTVPVIYQPQ